MTFRDNLRKLKNSSTLISSSWEKILVHRKRIDEKFQIARLRGAFLSITRACNATCPMCPRTALGTATKNHMDDKTFQKAIENYKKLGWIDVLMHSMGEPLLHPRFGTYVDNVVSLSWRVGISTNAFLLDRWMDSMLKIRALKYSIEGWDKQSHKRYRGLDFDRTYSNVKEFWMYSKGKIDYKIRILMTLYKENTLDDVRHFVETWGPWVDHISIQLVENPFYNHVHVTEKDLNNDNNLPPEHRGLYFPMYRKEKDFCKLLFSMPVIFPNGDVSVCCNDYENALIVGNIHERDLKEIFYGKKHESIRDEFKQQNVKTCGQCCTLYDYDEQTKLFLEESIKVKDDMMKKIKNTI